MLLLAQLMCFGLRCRLRDIGAKTTIIFGRSKRRTAPRVTHRLFFGFFLAKKKRPSEKEDQYRDMLLAESASADETGGFSEAKSGQGHRERFFFFTMRLFGRNFRRVPKVGIPH